MGFLRYGYPVKTHAGYAKAAELRRHGQSVSSYLVAHRIQNSRCAICKQAAQLTVDHCHETKQVRELLCQKCNRGLGHFDDDPILLKAAIEYVQRHKANPLRIPYKERSAPEIARRK